MKQRWYGVIGVALGALAIGGGVADAMDAGRSASNGGPSLAARAREGIADLAELIGLEDEAAVPGTIDDGDELLPQAKITLDEAITAATAASDGPLGEVDLEHYRGRLVFTVDVGDRDVKVDAADGSVLGFEADD